MAGLNRSSLISKMYKVLKQHYEPISVNGDRPLLEHMLFACCLENAHYDKAEKVYQHLSRSFFDWNEVRVSTVKELAEAMRELPEPAAAAANLKCLLQNVFETTYSFDLETVKKQNIGVGIKRLAKLEGSSPFVVAYATQHALGGHSIPLDRGALDVLYVTGIATEAERKGASVAGLERAIPKNKGIEFSSLLHQLAADYVVSPFSSNVKTLLLEINPDAKERLPKRGQKKEVDLAPAANAAVTHDGHAPTAKKGVKGQSEKHAAEMQQAGKPPARSAGSKESKKIAPTKPSGAAAARKKAPLKNESPVKPAKAHRPAGAALSRQASSTARKSAAKHLAKRKPR